ncbi:MAG: TMEM143 family protein [Bacteroidota bacterium]
MKREHFIPFDKEIILQEQIKEHNFNSEQVIQISKLFEILEHYFHYEGFTFNKVIKKNYVFFDPDKIPEEKLAYNTTPNITEFKENLSAVLKRGNYTRLENSVIEDAMVNDDLIGLQLKINFDYFKEYRVYCRGVDTYTEATRHWFFWKREKQLETFERVIIYIEYKDKNYFEDQKIKLEKLSFEPSSIILKSFKRVPKNDIETIFPYATPVMSLKDKLLLWIPALGGGIPLITTKVVPPLLAMYAAYKANESLTSNVIKTQLVQGLIALGLIGAYLFRQYKRFLTKKIEFSKMLSDSLYFKNIANNSGVFPAIIDAAEEEELKETILAYTFLLMSKEPITAKELDDKIEEWFKKKFNKEIDFDVEDALKKLEKLRIGIESNGKWTVIPIENALANVDEIWDSIFTYNE